jgi:RecB family exonuclease
LVKNDKNYYILDYKTGSAPKNSTFDFQTIIYLLSVKEFFKTENATFVYIDLRNKSEVQIQLTEELVDKYVKRLTSTVENIEMNDFAQNQAICPCEYNIICYK